jgi:glycogen operon protein
VKCLGVRLAGDVIAETDERGETISGDTMLLLLNAHHEPIPFQLPVTKPEHVWEVVFDTASDRPEPHPLPGGAAYPLHDRSMAVLRTRPLEEGERVSPVQVETLRKETRPPVPRERAVPGVG